MRNHLSLRDKLAKWGSKPVPTWAVILWFVWAFGMIFAMVYTLPDKAIHPYKYGKVCDQAWRWGKCRDLKPNEVCDPPPWNCRIIK